MKQIQQSIFLCLLMLVGMGMHAEEIPNNEIWYTSSDGEVVTPYDSEKFGATIISNTYSGGKGVIKLNKSVTSIGDWVFYNSSLTSVTIPNSVTSIGNNAFYNCKSLASVTIPNSVTSIGKWAFGDCSGLASITIPNSVKSIGEKAFYNCIVSSFVNNSSLNAIANKYWEAKICEKSGLIIEDNVVVDCAVWATSISIPNSVKSIGEDAFASCTNLTSIDIPNSVKSIGEDAFYLCSGLTSVAIPNSVTSIGNHAFWGCTNLISVTIPKSVTSIGINAFQRCTSLSSFKVNWTTPLSIKSDTFKDVELSGCTLYVPKGTSDLYKADGIWSNFGEIAEFTPNITYEATEKLDVLAEAFNASIVSHEFKDGKGTIIFNADVTSIGGRAFYECKNLTSINIPNSVTSIGDYAFRYCTGLTSIYIPNSVTSIGDYVFDGCSGLTSITVESGNPNYDSRDNCNAIIETATNTLIAGCMNTVIPNSVTGIGYGAFADCSGLASITIPNSVTSIGNWVFCSCTGLTSIDIPNSVTSIGDYAFYDCDGLTSITIPNSVTSIGEAAFYSCSGLTSITIPNSVRSIGELAFGFCSGLTSINIPNSVTSIGPAAFQGCTGLTSITIPNSVRWIENYVFYDCTGLTSIEIPNTVTSIGNNAFYRCTSLTSFKVNWTTPLSIQSNTFNNADLSKCTLYVPQGTSELYKADAEWSNFGEIAEFTPNNVITYEATEKLDEVTGDYQHGLHTDAFNASIVSHEFKDGKGTIIFDADVTSIGESAFYCCSDLTSIDIPNSVTSIGLYAFWGCSGLTSITMPNSVTSIREEAFGSCSGLTSITVESGNPNYDSRDNCNAIIETATNTLIAGCMNTVIPNSVTGIGYGAFYECFGLTSITIPNSVRSIGNCAFQNCTSLTSVDIPESVTSIGNSAFWNCSSLASVNIPESVTTIGKSAFIGCRSLTSVDIPESVTSIGADAFAGCSSLTSINIPKSVTSIGEYAFEYCTSLSSFKVNWTTPLSIKSGTFKDVELSGCTLYVPKGTSDLYKADAVWGLFGEIAEFTHNNVITYEATEKLDVLAEAFNASIVSHEFKDGKGTIIFDADVTSIGESAFKECKNLTSINIPNSVTSIGDYAFYLCSGLTSITIPNSVTSIGDYVFCGCSGLTSITVESGNPNYDSRDNCNALIETSTNKLITGCNSTVIPNSVTNIGEAAFYRCIGLTSITIPNSVTSIGEAAFYSCSGLTSITIPNSVTSIGDDVFGYCTGLTSITIPNSVTSIGDRAFYSCSGLTSINIPNSVTSIGESAFSYCTGLTSITIPNSVTSIGYEAFTRCSGLTSIYIPNSVTSIGIYAFLGCSGLTSITIPNSVTSIGYKAFSSCSGLTSIYIPNSVTSIDYEAFSSCSGLTSITVESGNPNYDSRDNCNAIIETATNTLIAGCMNTVIPNSVTGIGVTAFERCIGLTSINIPNSVTSIGNYAFYECTSLSSFKVNWTTPLRIYSHTFYNADLSKCTLYVPKGTSELYKADAEWGKFGEIKENSENAIRNTATSYSDIKVYASGNTITITGVSADEPVAVYNSNGVRVAFGTGNCSIQVNGNGVYYIRIEGRTFKICM